MEKLVREIPVQRRARDLARGRYTGKRQKGLPQTTELGSIVYYDRMHWGL